jgi:hypothetical protein
VNVEELLGMIPEDELEFLAAETKVDHQVKKLKGSLIFKLILYSMLDTERMSLRVMEALVLSARFKQFSQNEESKCKRGTRLYDVGKCCAYHGL